MEAKQGKEKITAVLVVTDTVVEMDYKKKDPRSRKMSKEVEGCVQDVVGKKFEIQFKNMYTKEVSNYFLTLISSEEEVWKGI